MSALPRKADIERHDWHVRFVPVGDIHIGRFRHRSGSEQPTTSAPGPRSGRAAPLAPTHDPELVAEVRPHPFGPRRIGGRFPWCRTRYIGRREIIEREVALRGGAGSAVATRAQGSGNRSKRWNVLGVVPFVELVLMLGSYAHR